MKWIDDGRVTMHELSGCELHGYVSERETSNGELPNVKLLDVNSLDVNFLKRPENELSECEASESFDGEFQTVLRDDQ